MTIFKNDVKCQTIKDKEKKVQTKIGNYNIEICPKKKIEVDGIYEINGINFSLFQTNEFSIIYDNIADKKDSFELAVVEVKLSIKKMDEFVNQLQRDFFVLGKITNKKIVFIVIVNSDSLSFNYKKNVEKFKFNCLILGIKNKIVTKRKITSPIDWNLVIDMKNLKNDVNGLKNDVNELKKDVQELKEKFENLNDVITFIKNNIEIKANKNPKKKTKRKKKIIGFCSYLTIIILLI